MLTNQTDKPSPANVTVKLDPSERDRLKSLAIAKKRTPHYIMREAIQKYLAEEELEQRFIAAAEQTWEHFEQTGEHVTLEEVQAWAKKLKKNPKAPIPPCHK